MSPQRGPRVVGWAVGARSAWIEELRTRSGCDPWVWVVWTRLAYGAAAVSDMCFHRSEAELLARTFVNWPES